MSKIELFEVVDNEGKRLRGTGPRAQHFYLRAQDAQGVATQYNNIIVIKDGEGVQLKGAPFKVKPYVAQEV